MTGRQLNEKLNDIFSLTEDNRGFFEDAELFEQTQDTYQEKTHDDLLEMLIKNYDENKNETWISMDNKSGNEGYYAKFPISTEQFKQFNDMLDNTIF